MTGRLQVLRLGFSTLSPPTLLLMPFVLPPGAMRFSRGTIFTTDSLEGLLIALLILFTGETRFSLGAGLRTGPLEGLLLLLLVQTTGERRFVFSGGLTTIRTGLLAVLLILLPGEMPLSLVPLDGLLLIGTAFDTFLTLDEDSDILFSSSSQLASVLCPFFLY
jgi:hypothetical protein